jgi:hypothetical protein
MALKNFQRLGLRRELCPEVGVRNMDQRLRTLFD